MFAKFTWKLLTWIMSCFYSCWQAALSVCPINNWECLSYVLLSLSCIHVLVVAMQYILVTDDVVRKYIIKYENHKMLKIIGHLFCGLLCICYTSHVIFHVRPLSSVSHCLIIGPKFYERQIAEQWLDAMKVLIGERRVLALLTSSFSEQL